MAHAQERVTVCRPVEEVFRFILDGNNNKLWRPTVTDIKVTVDEPGVGTIVIQGMQGPFGRRIDGDYVITECVKNKVISFRVIKGPARPEGTYDFEQDGDNTIVNFSLSFKPKGFARLMEPMIQKQMKLEVAAINNLKSYLESNK